MTRTLRDKNNLTFRQMQQAKIYEKKYNVHLMQIVFYFDWFDDLYNCVISWEQFHQETKLTFDVTIPISIPSDVAILLRHEYQEKNKGKIPTTEELADYITELLLRMKAPYYYGPSEGEHNQ